MKILVGLLLFIFCFFVMVGVYIGLKKILIINIYFISGIFFKVEGGYVNFDSCVKIMWYRVNCLLNYE